MNLTAEPNAAIILTAQWEGNMASVTYDANGGQGQGDDITGVTGQQVTVADNQFTRDGWKFTGWIDEHGTAYQSGDKIALPAGGMTLLAQWDQLPSDAPQTSDGTTQSDTGIQPEDNGTAEKTAGKPAGDALAQTGGILPLAGLALIPIALIAWIGSIAAGKRSRND